MPSARVIANTSARLGAARGEAAALWSGVGFDVSVQEIFLPLTTGGALPLVPDAVRGDPPALLALGLPPT